jgi:ABC-type thiamine transport system ATPase subunit
MLSQSVGDLLVMRRKRAQKQLAGADTQDARLDALVRARLVDESFAAVRNQLRDQLAGLWWSDFGLSKRLGR